MSMEHQQKLGQRYRSIRYFPPFGHALKSVNAGIMLSQLVYWQDRGNAKDGYFWKTVKELQRETCLSRHQQDAAKALLENHGLIYTYCGGNRNKRFFQVDLDMVDILLTRWLETVSQADRKAAMVFAEK